MLHEQRGGDRNDNDDEDPTKSDGTGGLFRTVCLNPKWTLRRQLLTAFGTTSILSIGAVMMIATLTTKSSGKTVKREARQSLTDQVTVNLEASTRYAAETLTKKLFDGLGGAAAIMEEAARDRIVGYPYNFESDAFVPFIDSDTKTNIYPLDSPPLDLEWNISSDITPSNAEYHIGLERIEFYGTDLSRVSTANGDYFMQGQCDPGVLDRNAMTYFGGCTDSNNNVTTGGVVHPTSTNKGLYEKSSDLMPLLKPIFESHTDVKVLGLYYANSGAGSVASFPGITQNTSHGYTSIGCDWMDSPNPLDPRKRIGSRHEIALCRPFGQAVSRRIYNPLERGWCKDQALNPGKTRFVGPYLDASSEKMWLITIGRAIYDRETKNFIGCTLLDVAISQIEDILDGVEIGRTSEIVLVSWKDGTVVASPEWDTSTAQDTVKLWELDLGIDENTFLHDLRSPVDFGGDWTPDEVKQAYSSKVLRHKGKLVATYPVPVPTEYDEAFRPEYLIVLTIEEEEVYNAVDEMDGAIDQDSNDIIEQTLIIGFAGMGLVLIIVVIVSLFLTKPLGWMAKVADQIVANAGNTNLEQGVEADREEAFYACTPKTEVTTLVQEFHKMVFGLGGTGAAKVAKHDDIKDVLNTIQWREGGIFEGFYCPRTFSPPMLDDDKPQPASTSAYGVSKIHKGLNVLTTSPSKNPKTCSKSQIAAESHKESRVRRAVKSPLFWYITLTIVTPLLLTMVAICVIVSLDVTDALPSWLEDVEDASIALEKYAIDTAAIARAYFGTEVIHEAVRDNFLLARMAGWLLFGALTRSDSFTTLETATEECKYQPYNKQCRFFRNKERAFCDCEWDDVYGLPCWDMKGGARQKQVMYFAGQARDSDPDTGNRFNISFVPGLSNSHDSSPGTTLWWDSQSDLPGFSKGSNASGYETTYDRVRVLSALSVVLFPIFNHARESGNENYFGAYVGFENDGMMIGYEGCDYSIVEWSNFRSTLNNKASVIRSGTLCPLDKWGYDCRCREWYDDGRRKGTSPDKTPIHVTAPYVFTGGEHIATTITSPLIDPRDDKHVGQTIVDFVPRAIINALENETAIGQSESGFAILVTPERDARGGDTVVGPGYKLSDETSPPIDNLVLPFDESHSDNGRMFVADVLRPMKNGSLGSSTFVRTANGGKEEKVYIAWAPVRVDTPIPRNPASFADGVWPRETIVYSVGIAIPEADLLLPFRKIEDDIDNEIDRSTAIMIVLIIAAAAIAAAFAGRVAISFSGTVRGLLDIVNRINEGTYGDSLPTISNGSREARMVYAAFKKLFTVVRFSNQAFYSGDIHDSYQILCESYELFCNLNNKKAIGIASNNLGNTLLQIGREMRARTPQTLFGSLTYNSLSIKEQARQHFNEAVENGEVDFYSAPEDMKADFAQQQSNRHFNRGIFLLETRSAGKANNELDQGYLDIKVARDYDLKARELADGSAETKLERFETILRRVEGLSTLLLDPDLIQVDSLWDIDELLDEAICILRVEFDNEESLLFQDISQTGRLQQLECQQINALVARDQLSKAFEIALRIVVEDEFILSTVLPTVATRLSFYLESLDPKMTMYINTSLASMGARTGRSQIKNVFFCLDYSGSMNARCASYSTGTISTRILQANKNLLKIFDDHVGNDDFCGFLRFNHLVDTWFGLTRKGSNPTHLRRLLTESVTAGGGTRMYRALSHAVDKITLAESCDYESWIIALTDGMSADGPREVMPRLQAVNSNRAFKIHVIVVGVEVPDSVRHTCQKLCTATEESAYIDARGGLDAMDEAFEQVANIISGRGTTMETF